MIKYKTVKVDNLNIFYREAGNIDKPTMVLFHGFPSASHMFRNLIPELETHFHLIAPDYPGFGQSEAPSTKDFSYTFDNLADVMNDFLNKINVKQYYLYVFDYGAPIGFRIAVKNPERVLGIVSQNGNVYEEGLGKKWEQRKDYWENPTEEKRNSYRIAFAPETIKGQYTFGTKDGFVSPDGYTLDIAYTQGEGYAERQLDLIFDYQHNVKKYPLFQRYLREYKPQLLAVWGKNDPSFTPAGAEAFKKDNPNTEVALLDTGHFPLETHAKITAELIKQYFRV